MRRSTQQSNRLFAILRELDIDADGRADLVEQFTDGRSTSSRDLSPSECDALNNQLQKQVQTSGQTMRRKILSCAHELGWETPEGKIDWPRLNGWLKKHGYLHKELNDYSPKELPTLVQQITRVTKHHYANT